MWSALPIPPAAAIGLAALLGLLVGGWLAAVAYRLPRIMEHDWEAQFREWQGDAAMAAQAPDPAPALLRGRWRCTACHAPITGWRAAPLLSWIGLRGRCANCRVAIPLRNPLIELACALLFGACAWRFGATPAALCAMALCGALVTLSAIDIETRLLPDVITLPLTWCGLLANAAHLYTTPVLAILGAASGYAVLWLLYHAFRLVTGREGLGYGDFKLLAALGAWFGLAQLPGLLLCASASGVVVGLALIVSGRARRGEAQPFGPFLALAAVVNLLALGGAPWWN